jgi:uncharacterized protein
VIFHIFGHSNVLGTHYNTLEFTKEDKLTKEGDCIIGIKADFDSSELKKIAKKFAKVKIIIKVGTCKDEVNALINKDFDDGHEIVVRKSEYPSKRTFGIRADKAAKDIDRKLIALLKNPETEGEVEVIGQNEENNE